MIKNALVIQSKNKSAITKSYMQLFKYFSLTCMHIHMRVHVHNNNLNNEFLFSLLIQFINYKLT